MCPFRYTNTTRYVNMYMAAYMCGHMSIATTTKDMRAALHTLNIHKAHIAHIYIYIHTYIYLAYTHSTYITHALHTHVARTKRIH